MRKRKIRKVKLATLVVFGEGAHDKAFLEHMKSLYDDRENGQKVTIGSADGGSPMDLIDAVIRKNRNIDYNRRYLLLDSDIPITQKHQAKAKANRITLIESTPHCLEGMLLVILSSSPPQTSKSCKDKLHKILSGKPTDPRSYEKLFPKSVLDQTKKTQIITLRNVLKNINEN